MGGGRSVRGLACFKHAVIRTEAIWDNVVFFEVVENLGVCGITSHNQGRHPPKHNKVFFFLRIPREKVHLATLVKDLRVFDNPLDEVVKMRVFGDDPPAALLVIVLEGVEHQGLGGDADRGVGVFRESLQVEHKAAEEVLEAVRRDFLLKKFIPVDLETVNWGYEADLGEVGGVGVNLLSGIRVSNLELVLLVVGLGGEDAADHVEVGGLVRPVPGLLHPGLGLGSVLVRGVVEMVGAGRNLCRGFGGKLARGVPPAEAAWAGRGA